MSDKIITKIIVGTNNPGKLKEIKDLLSKETIVFSPNDFKFKSPKEDGKTFEENSLIKAKFFSQKAKMICLADDSGLEIDILNKQPGIYSARWGGKNSDFKKAIKKVFHRLDQKDSKWKKKKVKAQFVCALTIYWNKRKNITVTGKVKGFISPKPKGRNGFGYDPIFIPLGYKNTFSQMKPIQKCRIDHRFKAFRKIKKFF